MLGPYDVKIIGLPTDWVTIVFTGAATLLGAVIGAGVSYLVAHQSAREARETARIARRDSEQAATMRAGVKLLEIVNLAAGYHHQTEASIEQSRKVVEGDPSETWRYMKAAAFKHNDIEIDAADLVAFLQARELNYVTEVLHLTARFNTMIRGVEAYSRRREALLAMITPTAMEGLVGTTSEMEAEHRRLAPYRAEVTDMAEQARHDMKEIYEMAVSVINKYGPIVRKYFDDPTFPIFAVRAASEKTVTNPKT